MEKKSVTELFFGLLKIAVGAEYKFPSDVSADIWQQIFDISQKQTLTGIVYMAIEKLPQEKRPPKELLLKWHITCEYIKKRNLQLDAAAARISQKFKEEGFRNAILKGQGIAQLYPRPEYRISGDIDIWLEGDRKEILGYVRKFVPDCKPQYHHVDFPVLKEVEIEVHFTPSFLNNFVTNRLMQRFFAQHADEVFDNTITTSAGELLHVPTLCFNRIYILQHIYKHLFDEGIGLRQMLDYYMVLMQGFDEGERAATMEILKKLHMKRFAAAVMYVMQQVFALPADKMLTPADAVSGELLLREIMIAGNFGKFDERSNNMHSSNALLQSIGKVTKNLRFITLYPSEVLASPFFRLWHHLWRRTL